MNTNREIEIVFCWFDKEQWELLAKVDPEGVDDTYEEWRSNANSAISEIVSNGQKVRKIAIKISELQKWCKEKGKEPISSSRSEYVAMLAQMGNEKKRI